MSEAPATRQQLQDAVEDLQSAMSDGYAFQGQAIKDLEDAVKGVESDVESLPDKLQAEIRTIRTKLTVIIEVIKQHGEFHGKTAKAILFVLNQMEQRERP